MSGSTAALAISSAALAQAEAAKTLACKATIQAFKAEGATVTQMNEYAGCVQRIYPDELVGGALVLVKVAIVLVLIGAVVGAVRGWTGNSFSRGEDSAMGFLFGAVAVAGGLLVVGLVVAGVAFLFS